jgi:hypothetical protein
VSNRKTVYRFHPETREYLGTDLADESPLEPGVWLVPAHATELMPPDIAPGKVARFATGYWVVENRRSPEDARELAYRRLAAHLDAAVDHAYERERFLSYHIETLGDDVAALEAFDPAAMWGK